MVEKDVQKRVLRALVALGGTATTKQLMDQSGLKRRSVDGATFHLKNRALISKKVVAIGAKRRVPPHKFATFKIREQLAPKIMRLISEIEE